MIALTLALALGTVAANPVAPPTAPSAAAPTAPAPDGSPATPPGDAPAADEPEAPVAPDVLGFLTVARAATRIEGTASRDGSAKLRWDGPGAGPLKMSADAIARRDALLVEGDRLIGALVDAIWTFYDSDGTAEPDAMRAKLATLLEGLDAARTAYASAVGWEERRLFFVEKALAQADAAEAKIPGIDRSLIERRIRAIRSGAVARTLAAQLDGYRDVGLGLVAFLERDNFRALERLRSAVKALPGFAVAHAFLGSMYFLFEQRDAAVAAWRVAYELDPSNLAVADALKAHGGGRPIVRGSTTPEAAQLEVTRATGSSRP